MRRFIARDLLDAHFKCTTSPRPFVEVRYNVQRYDVSNRWTGRSHWAAKMLLDIGSKQKRRYPVATGTSTISCVRGSVEESPDLNPLPYLSADDNGWRISLHLYLRSIQYMASYLVSGISLRWRMSRHSRPASEALNAVLNAPNPIPPIAPTTPCLHEHEHAERERDEFPGEVVQDCRHGREGLTEPPSGVLEKQL
ncbi:hypothetical protein KC347_g292 [Hortaea werneckii]|nr:hypothetical protein KC347_g292 [Hortaea werneckii]